MRMNQHRDGGPGHDHYRILLDDWNAIAAMDTQALGTTTYAQTVTVPNATVALAGTLPLSDLDGGAAVTVPLEGTVALEETVPMEGTLTLDPTMPMERTLALDRTVPMEGTVALDPTVPMEGTLALDPTMPLERTLALDSTVPLDATLQLDANMALDATMALDPIASLEEETAAVDPTVPLDATLQLDADATLPLDTTATRRTPTRNATLHRHEEAQHGGHETGPPPTSIRCTLRSRCEKVRTPVESIELCAIAGTEHEVSVGRGSDCTVQLAFGKVSKLHASVRVDALGQMWLVDRSTNGCFVNDERVPHGQPMALELGDVLRLTPFNAPYVIAYERTQ
mmetsp:Transcript_42764/g.107936  ORF Transcript_42764/g.107936 Transcript_42764/m.107936 type:complete len:340 (-) Transcript_42764:9-1028(-)